MLPVNRRTALSTLAGALVMRGAANAATQPRPGCQANGWDLDPNRFDLLLTAVREMKELGFQGFETNIRFVQPQLDRAAEARSALDTIGLEFIGAHTNLGDGEGVAKAASQARQFGAKALVLSGAALSPSGEFSADSLKKKANLMNSAGRACLGAGLTMAYHNHQPEFKNHAAEWTGLVENTDPRFVSFMLDIGHAWLAEPDAVSLFEKHHARVFGLHVRDFHDRVSVPLGQGEFPLRALAGVVRKTNWHGWLIDEEERPDLPHKPGKAATGPSRKTIREIFGV